MTFRDQLRELARLAEAEGMDSRALLGEFLAALPGEQSRTAAVPSASVDLDRAKRCGHPEVIYAPGKTIESLLEIVAAQYRAGQRLLATRVSPQQADAVIRAFPETFWNGAAGTLRLSPSGYQPQLTGRVAVVTAGTSDRPVAEEAVETLHWMEVETHLIVDVGVAGPWRLLERLPELQQADVVVVAAGMEGALPSVVGGWLSCPVIAVPTSTGYGASFDGVAALLGMLNSCAANVTVVNIDAGFKAGYIAGLIARSGRESPGPRTR